MKFLLTLFLVLAVAVVPVMAQQQPGPADRPAAPSGGAGTTDPAKPSDSAPSASPGMAAPAERADCANGGWEKFTIQKFTNETECAAWVEKQKTNK